jgi:hypothetical protein
VISNIELTESVGCLLVLRRHPSAKVLSVAALTTSPGAHRWLLDHPPGFPNHAHSSAAFAYLDGIALSSQMARFGRNADFAVSGGVTPLQLAMLAQPTVASKPTLVALPVTT